MADTKIHWKCLVEAIGGVVMFLVIVGAIWAIFFFLPIVPLIAVTLLVVGLLISLIGHLYCTCVLAHKKDK